MATIYDVVFDFLFLQFWKPSKNRTEPKYYTVYFKFSNLLSNSAECRIFIQKPVIWFAV